MNAKKVIIDCDILVISYIGFRNQELPAASDMKTINTIFAKGCMVLASAAPRKELEMISIAFKWNISLISQAPLVM